VLSLLCSSIGLKFYWCRFKNGFSTLNESNKRDWVVRAKSGANLGLLPIRAMFIVFAILPIGRDRS